jgi:DMSO/TMAO reductase YedYZ molybdopterin-dependent catalytic subunit
MRLVSSTPTRRRFLEASAAAAVATWLGRAGYAGAAPPASTKGRETSLGTVPFVDEGEFPLERTVGAGLGRRRALDLSTLSPESVPVPQDRFFIRTGRPDPFPATSGWKIRMRGLVEAPADLEVAALQREADDRGAHVLECAGNSRSAHFGLMSVARWTGVPLERVLGRLRLLPRASQVLVSGFDRHSVLDPGSVPGASWVFGLAAIREARAFLATGMNGAPLSPDHGDPIRLVVPGWYGCTAIKWVDEIALVDDEALPTDQMREYAGRTHQDPAGPRLARDFQPATIDPAAAAVRVDMFGGDGGKVSYRIAGLAWGGRTPPRALAIRFRPEAPFAPVERIESGEAGAWTFWSHTFRPTAPGRHRIELAVRDPGVRTRRLDMGYYAREVEIARVWGAST